MTSGPSWTPHACPRCGEHRLVVTRVRCADCGLELAADDLGSCGAHDDTRSAREPGDEVPAASGSAASDDPARAQILARVASGDLAPAVAAQLLASLGSRPA